MNNRERAERIWDDLSGRAGCGIDAWEPAIKTECLDMIAAQIDEAVKEAKAEDYAAGAIEQQKRCRAHKAEAYEDAAKIAELYESGGGISREIRARKDEAVREYATQVKEPIRCAYDQGYAAAREQAAGIVDERLRQNEIATELQALPGNKFAKKVRAWMFDMAERIRAMVPRGEVGK